MDKRLRENLIYRLESVCGFLEIGQCDPLGLVGSIVLIPSCLKTTAWPWAKKSFVDSTNNSFPRRYNTQAGNAFFAQRPFGAAIRSSTIHINDHPPFYSSMREELPEFLGRFVFNNWHQRWARFPYDDATKRELSISIQSYGVKLSLLPQFRKA